MIYLFEDRKGRMLEYFSEGINNSFLKEAIFDCSDEEIDQYIHDNFKDATCILFHKSYNFPNRRIKSDLVKESFLRKNIPFVYFSGGLKNNLLIDKQVYTGNVDSGDMYNNLNLFLEQKSINIPLLIYGTRYLLNSLLELQNRIIKYLFDKLDNQTLNNDDLDEIEDIIYTRINEPELAVDKSKLTQWIQNKIGKEEIKIEVLKSQIEKLIEKY
ncbi:hypothetical protein [Chryseobacterium oryzae]|uniref:Uncharacterized protein n=1 Tax=Chryseobacterium oryzae TaxID=2929799 RepID=A0ABY4BKL2_9FLAO|nr:hypothetical protein [Chryseobacterium oryzae]UOE39710.1 hypothetical protein MTP08_14555 [Chryseobacterium oryzae]